MSTVLTRSTAEILRLTRRQWDFTEIYAFLVDTTGAGTQPTAASSATTWISYALVNPNTSLGFEPYVVLSDSSFSYNSTLGRAQTGELTFNFNSFITNEFDEFTSTTVTHVIFADLFTVSQSQPPIAVIQETTPLTLTSSSTLSYKLRLFGRAA
jgi:hypothetical protein